MTNKLAQVLAFCVRNFWKERLSMVVSKSLRKWLEEQKGVHKIRVLGDNDISYVDLF